MKILLALVFSSILLTPAAVRSDENSPDGAASTPAQSAEITPAERAIDQARRAIAARPEDPRGHVALAMGLARRGRETADMDFYAEGEKALARAFELDPDHLDAARARAWLLLGQHRFAAALEVAESVGKRFPDDMLTHALIADAAVELGDYARAEETVQFMLDMRPGSGVALTRGAYLRELFGDLPGALDWMREALHSVRPTESEDRAWILTHMAHLERLRGELGAAARLAEAALDTFTDYHYAVAQLAKIREAQGRTADAIDLWTRHYEMAPHPENLFYLAKAKHAAGDTRTALTMMAEFEAAAIAESGNEDNANRDLVLYYVDYADAPAKALALAERELQRRRDVLTLDAYAWALRANGRREEARETLQQVLDVGVKDPDVLAHAKALGLS